MWWTYLKNENKTIDAAYKLNAAKNMAEARQAASLIHAPGLNVMYGDKEGNVAWWACAKLVKRPPHVNSKLILDGSSGNDDPLGYYGFSENPKAENPAWGFVYSANNQPYTEGQPLYPGYYLPEDRARRIVELLEEKNDWTAEGAKKMITDATSDNAPEITATVLSALDRTDLSNMELTAISLLESWEGDYFTESTAPVIYNKLIYHIIYGAMADELGSELFDVYNGTHLMKRSTQDLMANNRSKWWDDINTKNNRETRSEIINAAFKKTIAELQKQLGNDIEKWQWGDVHTLEHKHSFAAVPSLKKYFDVGPFNMPGNTETINNQLCRLQPDGTYEIYAGPSTRRIVDFANVAGNSWSILPTGQSGNVMSPHYKDQAQMYAKGEFRKQLMDKEEIKKTAKYKAVIKPN